MKLENISARIAPRNAWQAIDLGTHLFRHWWRPLLQVWLAFSLPLLMLALLVSHTGHTLLAWLLLWWFKPLLERPLLEFSARALFDERPSLSVLLRQFHRYALPGILSWLTWRRIYWNRSALVPIRQLEQLHGPALIRREQLLDNATPSRAMWLTVLMVHIEQLASYALIVALMMLLPSQHELDSVAWYFEAEQYPHLSLISWYLVLCITQPLYVTCGFALYLNQRTWLEGWDLEIGLRQIGQQRQTRNLLGIALLALLLPLSLASSDAYAASDIAATESAQAARDDAIAVIASPEFTAIDSEGRWRLKHDADDNTSDSRWLRWIIEWLLDRPDPNDAADGVRFADLIRALLWSLVIALLVWLIWHYRHWLSQLRLPEPAARARPTHIQGLDIRRSSLPESISDNARQMLAQAEYRALLSLLLRGTLSRLLDQQPITLSAGATEQECLAILTHTHDDSVGTELLAVIVGHWLAVAWRHHSPDPAILATLLTQWTQHFEPARSTS